LGRCSPCCSKCLAHFIKKLVIVFSKENVQRAQLAHSHCRHHISNTNEMRMEHRMRSEQFGHKQAHRSKKARPAAQMTPAALAT
jgi:hypothetical protein